MGRHGINATGIKMMETRNKKAPPAVWWIVAHSFIPNFAMIAL